MADQDQGGNPRGSSTVIVVLAWVAVGIPMLWGVMMTVKKAALLFR